MYLFIDLVSTVPVNTMVKQCKTAHLSVLRVLVQSIKWTTLLEDLLLDILHNVISSVRTDHFLNMIFFFSAETKLIEVERVLFRKLF